jgi:dTDP-4-amino-4,6-dideoxygalactose transaminase
VSSGTLMSERLSRQVLSLPMHPYLEFLNQQKIADLVVRNL